MGSVSYKREGSLKGGESVYRGFVFARDVHPRMPSSSPSTWVIPEWDTVRSKHEPASVPRKPRA